MIMWSHKNRFKIDLKIDFLLKNTIFDYKTIYLQKYCKKYCAECMQTYIRTHNFFRVVVVNIKNLWYMLCKF